MFRNATLVFAILALALGLSSCKDKEPAPVAPAAPPPAPVPVAEPVETDAPDTDTGTATEPELPPTEEPAQTAGIGKNSVIGNYTCSIDGDFPVTPPPASCKIYEGSDGKLKIAPIGGTGISGNIAIKGNSLKLTGAFNIGIGNLTVNASLNRRSAKLYKGKGTGSFAGASVKYTLTLKKM